jgi:hypothetical protein
MHKIKPLVAFCTLLPIFSYASENTKFKNLWMPLELFFLGWDELSIFGSSELMSKSYTILVA